MSAMFCKKHGTVGSIQMCTHVFSNYKCNQPTILGRKVTLHLNDDNEWAINNHENGDLIGTYNLCEECIKNYTMFQHVISDDDVEALGVVAQHAVCCICYEDEFNTSKHNKAFKRDS